MGCSDGHMGMSFLTPLLHVDGATESTVNIAHRLFQIQI